MKDVAKLSKVSVFRSHGTERREILSVLYNASSHDVALLSCIYEEQKFSQRGNTISYSAFTTSIDVTEIVRQRSGFLDDVQGIDWESLYREHCQQEESYGPSCFGALVFTMPEETFFLSENERG